jgi:hypothetical protein
MVHAADRGARRHGEQGLGIRDSAPVLSGVPALRGSVCCFMKAGIAIVRPLPSGGVELVRMCAIAGEHSVIDGYSRSTAHCARNPPAQRPAVPAGRGVLAPPAAHGQERSEQTPANRMAWKAIVTGVTVALPTASPCWARTVVHPAGSSLFRQSAAGRGHLAEPCDGRLGGEDGGRRMAGTVDHRRSVSVLSDR